MPPRTMTKMIATGVSHAKMFVCSALAPVMNGEVCARQSPGAHVASATRSKGNDSGTRRI